MIDSCILGAALLAQVPALWILRRRRDFWGSMHVAFFMLFFSGIGFLNSWSDQAPRGDALLTLAVALSEVLYVWIWTLLWLNCRSLADSGARLLDRLARMSDGWIILALLLWFGSTVVLVGQGGLGAIAAFRSAGVDVLGAEVSVGVKVLQTMSRAFAEGAVVAVAVRLGGATRPRTSTLGLSAFFLAVYTVLRESLLGPRRFLLLVALTGLLSVARQGARFTVRPKALVAGVAAFMLAIGGSIYYQSVRSNFNDPAVLAIALGGGIDDLVEATRTVLRPGRGYETPRFLREGPSGLLRRVVAARVDMGRGTQGAILFNAIKMVVPERLAPFDKPEKGADDFLYEEMGVVPPGGKIDVATSLSAIFWADVGVLALFLAPLVVFLLMWSFLLVSHRVMSLSPLIALYSAHGMISLAGSAEGSLVAPLVLLRDLGILVIMLMPGVAVLRVQKLWRVRLSETLRRIPPPATLGQVAGSNDSYAG